MISSSSEGRVRRAIASEVMDLDKMHTMQLVALIVCMQSAYSTLLELHLQLMLKLLIQLQKQQDEILNMLNLNRW